MVFGDTFAMYPALFFREVKVREAFAPGPDA